MDLCKIFGVEAGEEFKIKGIGVPNENEYKIEKEENGKCYLLHLNQFNGKYSWERSALYVNSLVNAEIEKKKKFTEEEKIILKNIDKEFEYIARDKEGILYLYTKEPQRGPVRWRFVHENERYTRIPTNSIFQNIKWADTKPVRIDDYVER